MKKHLESKNNQAKLKRFESIIGDIRDYETKLRKKQDLVSETSTIKKELETKKRSLEEVLVPAFAIAAEAARRIRGEEVYDVQIMAGLILHEGSIADMKSGEGKTLTAVLPAYLNALVGQVHIATQNDYLARRDADQMDKIFEITGLDTSAITSGMSTEERAKAYQAPVVYATNHELVFDYLYDEMRYTNEKKIFPGRNFAIVDEIDSILIDEARTPLIVSELVKPEEKPLTVFADLIKSFKEGQDFVKDIRLKTAYFTEQGYQRAIKTLQEKKIQLDASSFAFYLDKALKAELLFHNEDDYIVDDNKVSIIDEFTGRLMRDRRYMDGIHQAIEAKEGVPIGPKDKILAMMTYQSFFSRYKKLAGITGTLHPEEEEFRELYKVGSVFVPTNKKIQRDDKANIYFMDEEKKFAKVLTDVVEIHKTNRPILIATISIKDSKKLSAFLSKNNIKHRVLNAESEDEEKEIVNFAGKEGAITVATNMAGRGTDIEIPHTVKELGGLAVIATKANQSRRVDNQLRGRAGRQGEPGSSQFYIAATDELFDVLNKNEAKKAFERVIKKKAFVENDGKLNAVTDKAQGIIESRDRSIRELYYRLNILLEHQRREVYKKRDRVYSHPHIITEFESLLRGEIAYAVRYHTYRKLPARWPLAKMVQDLSVLLPQQFSAGDLKSLTRKKCIDRLTEAALLRYREVIKNLQGQTEDELLKRLLLEAIDDKWSRHLEYAEMLQNHISVATLDKRDPLKNYREKLHARYDAMLIDVRSQAVRNIFYFAEKGLTEKIEVTKS